MTACVASVAEFIQHNMPNSALEGKSKSRVNINSQLIKSTKTTKTTK